jgi:serine/threonine protein kinase
VSASEGTIIASSFRLVRPLSEGGMGTVWLAHHTRLDVPCAVKFLRPELASRADLVSRFEREAKAAAHLKGPHVVEILDYGIFEDSPYIAMELLVGEDLAQRIHRAGRLSAAATLTIVEQIGRALEKAHAAGIVHRDLKPENVFLVRDGDREIAKVLDFGIAKDAGCQLRLTTKGMVLGTPTYMSPEQIMGRIDVDHRADLWSLAVVAFQCMTGRVPVSEESFADMAAAIALRPLPPPSSMLTDLPPGIDAWWQKATAKDRGGRFQSAREMVDALSLALGAAPRAPSAPEIAPRPPRRRMAATIVASSELREAAERLATHDAMAAVIARETATIAGPARGALPSQSFSKVVWSGTPAPRRPRSRLWAGALMGLAMIALAAFGARWWFSPSAGVAAARGGVAPTPPTASASATAVPSATGSGAKPVAPRGVGKRVGVRR